MNKFFDTITVLTTHRTEECRQELEWHHIKASYFHSIAYDDPTISFNHSYYQILKLFVESEKENILMLEDDVYFRGLDRMEQIMQEAKGYDILYLGGNFTPYEGHKKAESYSPNLRRIKAAWTTHAVAYNRRTAEWIVENYKMTGVYDAWLNEQLEQFNTLAVTPMIAKQKPGRSSLMNQSVDYSNIFQLSDNYLLSI